MPRPFDQDVDSTVKNVNSPTLHCSDFETANLPSLVEDKSGTLSEGRLPSPVEGQPGTLSEGGLTSLVEGQPGTLSEGGEEPIGGDSTFSSIHRGAANSPVSAYGSDKVEPDDCSKGSTDDLKDGLSEVVDPKMRHPRSQSVSFPVGHGSRSSTSGWMFRRGSIGAFVAEEIERAHTITALIVFSACLVFVAIFEVPSPNSDFNTKRGLIAVVFSFLVFGVIQTPDGPFIRPHPAFWRFILCLSIVYELACIFLLFQTVDDARKLLRHFDGKLGVPLPEKDYGGNCLIYDANNTDPWHNLKDKMDGFVATHFFGWWLKTLLLRDWWLCTVLSIMFEVLEYTLEHQLPNFSECWWDHWIMDALICNGGGIYLGMKTLNYLSMKPYHWRGMWNIPTYGGMLKRVAQQFTPYSWTDYEWKPTSSLKRWLSMLGVISIFLLAELNTFYLKFVLWIPPDHYLCLGRLVFFLFMGAASMKETFQFLDDPTCKKYGRQAWLISAIIITEFLIVMKFDWATVTKPLPMPVAIFWIIGLCGLFLWTILKFYILKDVKHDIPDLNPSYKQKPAATNGKKNHSSNNDDSGMVTPLRSRTSLRGRHRKD